MFVSPVRFGFNKFSEEFEPRRTAIREEADQKVKDAFDSTFDAWYAKNEHELKGFLSQDALPGTGYELRDLLLDVYEWKSENRKLDTNFKFKKELKRLDRVTQRVSRHDLNIALRKLESRELVRIWKNWNHSVFSTDLGHKVAERLQTERLR